MTTKEFFIYADRDKLQTLSTIEYRVENLLGPTEFKSAIKGKS